MTCWVPEHWAALFTFVAMASSFDMSDITFRDTVNRGELIRGGELIWTLIKMLKTYVISAFYCQFSIFFPAKSNDQFMLHPAKKGINLVHCLGYIYVVRSRSFETFLGEIFLFYLATCHCTVSFLCLFQVGRSNFKSLGWRVNLLRHLKHDIFTRLVTVGYSCHEAGAWRQLGSSPCKRVQIDEKENSSCAFQNKVFFSLL